MGLLELSLLLTICLQLTYAQPFNCKPEDKAALLSFRRTLVDDPSADKESCEVYNWNENTDCCNWRGIDCDYFTGSVTSVSVSFSCHQGTRSTFSSNSSLFHLTSLEYLYISHLNLQQSAIPNEIANLTELIILSLDDCNLRGPIPESIGRLPNLYVLDLSSNTFSGRIPLSLSELQDLKTLSLFNCELTGGIPVNFFSHPKLSFLSLAFNQLDGFLPSSITSPSNFTFLQLSRNNLIGQIPSWLFSVSSLSTLYLDLNGFYSFEAFPKPEASSLGVLDLSFNDIEGPFPSSLLQLEKIVWLDLKGNQFTGVVEWNAFRYMENLTTLDLSLNRGLNVKNSDGDPASFPLLEVLNLRSCGLTSFPSFLSKYQSLEALDVSDNGIGGAIFTEGKGGWKKLTAFNGSHNRITEFEYPNTILVWFDMSSNLLRGSLPKSPPSLEILSLASNRFSGPISTQFCDLRNLTDLDLGYNNLDGELPPCLLNVSRDLRFLSFQNNRFHGFIPDTFDCSFGASSDLGSLGILMLSNNFFGGTLPKSLRACEWLRVLDVGNNQITGAFPSWLGRFANLQILILSSNLFNGNIDAPGTEEQFTRLQILDVSSNYFTGSISPKFLHHLKYMKNSSTNYIDFVGGYPYRVTEDRLLVHVDLTVKGTKLKGYKVLNDLTVLDFSNNRFSGKIPAIVGELKNLKVLTLSMNQLSGEIPSTIGNVEYLESLDLSRNKLGGSIPRNLVNLKRLEYLNLTYNNIQGRIPLSKFPAASYIGNSGLCGPPLAKTC